MTRPVRIQLSRAKGFRLQAVSLAVNGLACVKVDRSTKWGNPYDIGDRDRCWRATVVEIFKGWIREPGQAELRAAAQAELRGKNLACWCPQDGGACHADVLLAIANGGER